MNNYQFIKDMIFCMNDEVKEVTTRGLDMTNIEATIKKCTTGHTPFGYDVDIVLIAIKEELAGMAHISVDDKWYCLNKLRGYCQNIKTAQARINHTREKLNEIIGDRVDADLSDEIVVDMIANGVDIDMLSVI